MADALRLAERLPPGRHVLNACTDRYHFTVGFAACLISGRVSLLPPTRTPEIVRRLAAFAPDAFSLTDTEICDIDLPQCRVEECLEQCDSRGPGLEQPIPLIPDNQLAAVVFTSGSTGAPIPYRKTWGRLVRCVRAAASRHSLLGARPHALIGTVPPQHMYGLESTVLLALQSGHALTAERPFYPADICASIEAVPRPRALVTTPIHLRTLLAAGVPLPQLDLLVSATAPLTTELAQEAEERFHARLIEIYGSTETGQIASRRTTETAAWNLWPDVRLTAIGDTVQAQGGHVEQVTAMPDILEIIGEHEFLLHGRTADLIDVAGKRSSFGYLNAQLTAIPGVVDGAFFWRDLDGGRTTGVARLAAAAVAPGMSPADLIELLRQRIDPAFLPRPLLLVDRMPRNTTGKLPQQSLRELAERSDDR